MLRIVAVAGKQMRVARNRATLSGTLSPLGKVCATSGDTRSPGGPRAVLVTLWVRSTGGLDITKPGPPVGVVIEVRKPSVCPLFSGRVARDFSIPSAAVWKESSLVAGGEKEASTAVHIQPVVLCPGGKKTGMPWFNDPLYPSGACDVREPGWPGPLGCAVTLAPENRLAVASRMLLMPFRRKAPWEMKGKKAC